MVLTFNIKYLTSAFTCLPERALFVYRKCGGFFYLWFSVQEFCPCVKILCTKKIQFLNTMFIIIHRLCRYSDNLCQHGMPSGYIQSDNRLNSLYRKRITRSSFWSLNLLEIMGKCIGELITSRSVSRCYNLIVCYIKNIRVVYIVL